MSTAPPPQTPQPQASPPQVPPPRMQHPPAGTQPPSGPTKEEPWGQEDPLLWSARKVRFHAIWGSVAIALFVLMFGVGMYRLFTAAVYEGDIEGNASLLLVFLIPFILAIVGAVAAGALARNVGRMAKQPLAPSGARTARGLLWFSVFLWIMLFVVFPLSATVTTGEGEDAFPVGIITVLPAYIGFCLAIYVTGAAYAAWSRDNKVECMLIIGLGWAAFAMFLLLPAVINSWNLGAENPDVDWDSVVWWLRFGSLFPAIAPWLIVVGLYFVNTRNIALLEEEVKWDGKPHHVGDAEGATDADACPSCGGSLTVHPKTLETFCAACGWGLQPEAEAAPIVVDAAPAPTHADQSFVEQTPPSGQKFCGDCGTKLSVLTKTEQVFCPGCGAGLPTTQGSRPSQEAAPQTSPPDPAPAGPVPQTLAPSIASSIAPQAPAPDPVPPAPVPAPAPAPAPSPSPEPTASESSPGNCPLCGAMLAVHPRTGERFCPACGAGLGPGQQG